MVCFLTSLKYHCCYTVITYKHSRKENGLVGKTTARAETWQSEKNQRLQSQAALGSKVVQPFKSCAPMNTLWILLGEGSSLSSGNWVTVLRVQVWWDSAREGPGPGPVTWQTDVHAFCFFFSPLVMEDVEPCWCTNAYSSGILYKQPGCALEGRLILTSSLSLRNLFFLSGLHITSIHRTLYFFIAFTPVLVN